MSGPKCCQVTVDWEVLERQQQTSQQDDEAKLQELETLARNSTAAGSSSDEALQRTIDRLKQRVEARRVQLEERRKREEQAAAARLAQARDEFQQAHAAWQEALAARLDIELGHPGMALPRFPNLPAADLSSETTIRAAIQQLRAVALAYQHEVDSAIAEYRNSAAATSRMKEWIGGFKARAVRNARDIITALEPDGLFVADRADKDRIERIAKAATEVVRPLQQDGFNVSNEFIDQLDRVFSAETSSAAQTELERLRVFAERESMRLTQIKITREKQQREREKLKQRERTLAVADQITRTLEDLNYSVGQIDRTAFVSKGHFYAIDNEWPDHALRFELNAEDGQMRTVPVRIQEASEQASEADVTEQLKKDKEFDAAWCSKTGLGRIKETLANRGITARFKIEHDPGELVLEQVPETALDQQLRKNRRSGKDDGSAIELVRSRSRNTQR